MIRTCITVISCIIFFSSISSADIPHMINYQGKVTDSGGTPVPDGTYSMRFGIYDQLLGGSPEWDSGDQNVDVTDGIFSVLLGGTGQPAIDLSFDTDLWLQVGFEGDIQSPRRRLASVGYAYMASGLVPGTIVSGPVIAGPAAAILCANTATSGFVYGGRFSVTSPDGIGVFGNATSGTGFSFGGWFNNTSENGVGVYGTAVSDSGFTQGVYGLSSSSTGAGVYGYADDETGLTYGVYGAVTSPDGVGTYGYNSAASDLAYGVFGVVDSPDGKGVFGWAKSTSGDASGVFGQSDAISGYGVYGWSNQTTGISVGVYGESESSLGDGVTGYSPNVGVKGVTSVPTSGLGVYYSGGLGGSGSKSCIVKTSQGPTYMYCQESPECWFEDFGGGQLINGRCRIELDPLFLETVTIDGMNPLRVFIQLRGQCNGVFVEEDFTGFDVIELHDGTSSASFHYRVVAKRKGFEEKRLDYCKTAENDPFLYPELREEYERKRREDHARMQEKLEGMIKGHAGEEQKNQKLRERQTQRMFLNDRISENRSQN